MFDVSTCLQCCGPCPPSRLYCSDECQKLEPPTSSAASSSASTSPSRSSASGSGANGHDKKGHARHSTRYSTNSSRTSSPSLYTSDFQELSDEDVEIVAANDRKTRNLSGNPFHRKMDDDSPDVYDMTFWKAHYASLKTFKATDRPPRDNDLVTTVQSGLTFVRKPGQYAGGYLSRPSHLKANHRRIESEYGYDDHVGNAARVGRKGSAESAASSTPRSKATVSLAASVTRLQVTGSDSTLNASLSRPSAATSSTSPKPFSDTAVPTLRKSALQFTIADEESGPIPPSPHSSVEPELDALSALKDVARNHGIEDRSTKSRSLLSENILRRVQNSFKSETDAPHDSQFQKVNDTTHTTLRSYHGRQDAQEGRYDSQSDDSPKSNQNARGRSRQKWPINTSPSSRSWASWADDEPVVPRGRSARRGQ